MNYQDFREKIQARYRWERYWYYGVSITAILFSIYQLFALPAHAKPSAGANYVLILFLSIVGLCAYAIFLLPQRYRIISIPSQLDMEQKKELVANVQTHLGLSSFYNEEGLYTMTYQKSFWSSRYNIFLYFDNDNFYFTVQGVVRGRGGFIDFGGAEWLRKKISDEIELLQTGYSEAR